MKFVLFITVIFLSTKSMSQGLVENDSLGKYSYGAILADSKSDAYSTGFFIKGKSALWFVTTKHSISGCIYDHNTYKFKIPDTMIIVIRHLNIIYSIRIREISDSILCTEDSSKEDFIAFKIPLKFLNYVNVAEYDYAGIEQSGAELKIWGCPGRIYDTSHFPNPINLYLPAKTLEFRNHKSYYDFIYPEFMNSYGSMSGFLVPQFLLKTN